MTPTAVGAWLLLLGGLGVLAASAWRILARGGSARPSLFLVGFVAAGLGAYGPTFLDPYTRFVGVLKRMGGNPGPDSYGEASVAVASGRMPKSYEELVLAYMVCNPIPELDPILDRAAKGSEDPRSAGAIEKARKELAAKKATAERIAHAITTRALEPDVIRTLDAGTRSLVAAPLLSLKVDQLRALGLERADLRGLIEAPRTAFISDGTSP